MFNAFVKGLYFSPDSSYTFGLFLPMMSVITTTLVVFGLLEVGDTILDPFGSDPEDFTILHFIEFTAASTLAAIEVDSMAPVMRDRKPTTAAEAENFYSPQQVAGALRLVSRMIARHRARKARQTKLMDNALLQAVAAEKERGGSYIKKRRTPQDDEGGGVRVERSPKATVISPRAALPEASAGGSATATTTGSRSSSQHTDAKEASQTEAQAKLQSWATELEQASPPTTLSPGQVAEAKIERWAAEVEAERQEIREEDVAHRGEPHTRERAPSSRADGAPLQRRKRRHGQGRRGDGTPSTPGSPGDGTLDA